MSVATAMSGGVGRLLARARRDEEGSYLLEIAVGVLIAAGMGTVMLFAVNAFWPGVVESVLGRVGDLIFGE